MTTFLVAQVVCWSVAAFLSYSLLAPMKGERETFTPMYAFPAACAGLAAWAAYLLVG